MVFNRSILKDLRKCLYCLDIEKSDQSCIYVLGIDFLIRLWNCSDNVVFCFSLFFNLYVEIIPVKSTYVHTWERAV